MLVCVNALFVSANKEKRIKKENANWLDRFTNIVMMTIVRRFRSNRIMCPPVFECVRPARKSSLEQDECFVVRGF